MGRYRKLDPRIHNDAKFMALSERGQRLFMTILTHPHMTALGAMRATRAGLCTELAHGFTENLDEIEVLGEAFGKGFCQCFGDSYPEILEKVYRVCFGQAQKLGLFKYDPKASCLFVPNFLKYNPPENANVVVAWYKALDLIPECLIKNEMIAHLLDYLYKKSEDFRSALEIAFMKAFGKGFREAFREAMGDGFGDTFGETGARTGAGAGTVLCVMSNDITLGKGDPALAGPGGDGQEPGSNDPKELLPSSSPAKAPKRPKAMTAQQLLDLWNEVDPIPGMQQLKMIPERKRKIDARISFNGDPAFWLLIFQKIKDSPFLRGEEKSFRAALDWVVKNNLHPTKIYEGFYDEKRKPTPPSGKYANRKDRQVVDLDAPE